MRKAAWMHPLLLAAALLPPLALAPAAVYAQPKGAKGSTAPDEAAAKRATAFFTKGNDLLKAKKYSLALDQFKQSYAAVPSPNSHLYIARCLAALGDSRAAYIEFTKVIEEAEARAAEQEKYAPTRDAAKVDREELVPKLAMVTVSVPQAGPNATVRIGAELVPREQWDKPIPFPPGNVDATLQIEGRPDVTQTLTLAAGEKKSIVLNPAGAGDFKNLPGSDTAAAPPPPPPSSPAKRSPLRPAAFVAGGVGVVGMVMFAVAGPMSQATYASLKEKCGLAQCSSDHKSEIAAGKTQQVVANVGAVVGAVGLAAGVTLFVLSLRPEKTESAPSAHIVISPSYAGLHGTF